MHPEDPLGSASQAAGYLFEECYRQGVLTSEFFLNDKRFLGKIRLTPDAALRTAFFEAVKHAQELAQLRLNTTPDDTNALFAMALSLGMEADYASLIDKQQLDADNLKDAIQGESYETDSMYLEFAEKARVAGDTAAAARFKEIRHDEMGHRDAFKIALTKLES